MAEVLARTRRRDIVKHLPTLAAAAAISGTGRGAGHGVRAASGSRRRDPAGGAGVEELVALEGVLGSMREAARPVPPARAAARRCSPARSTQRTAAVWHLFFASTSGDAIPRGVLAAAAPKPIAAGRRGWRSHLGSLRPRDARARPRQPRDRGRLGRDDDTGEANSARAQSLPLEAYAYLSHRNAELKASCAVTGRRGTLKRARRSARGERHRSSNRAHR